MSMKPRDRVLTALKRTGIPDRVPLQFDLCRQLTDSFGETYGIPIHYTTSYFEDLTYRISANELRTAMGSDCVVVGGSLPRGYSHPTTDDGCIINEFGMVMRQGPLYMETIEAPLKDVSSVAEVESFPFPDPLADGRFDDARLYTEKYRDDYFIIGDLELTMFEMSWHMVGLEKFMMDMALGEPYIEALIDRVKEFSIGIGKSLVDLGVDGIWFGDDFGAQNGMLISPRMWRRVFKPRYAELFQEFKARNPDLLIMYHTDGAVAPILDDLVEIGLEVFNPVQPNVPGHEAHDLKSGLGDRLSFWGAIDQQHLLPNGTAAEIEADVAEKIRVLGDGGGYMCAPAHIVQSDVSPENVEAFIAAVMKHGSYS
ncbi:MAG: uroporphyrinogen decarboxylase family protein [Chloroflexota bacterium]|nr:uroporphyrinogen decarboxylase family protein [Chloroflexota bacterium]